MRKWIHICFPQYCSKLCWIIMIENNFYLFTYLFIIFGCAYGLKKVTLEKNLCSFKTIWDMLFSRLQDERLKIKNISIWYKYLSKRHWFSHYFIWNQNVLIWFSIISKWIPNIYIDEWKWIILSDINKKSSCILFIFFLCC